MGQLYSVQWAARGELPVWVGLGLRRGSVGD
jgi:hypothetical protein